MPRGTKGDNVPVATMRRAFEDSGLSQSEVAKRMGWMRTVPDYTRLRQALGKPLNRSAKPDQRTVTYERAIELIEAMGLDPVDYDL